MLNEPPNKKERRPHPLERAPETRKPEPTTSENTNKQRVTLHIPMVRPRFVFVLIAINALVFALGLFDQSLQRTMFIQGAANQQAVLIGKEYYRLFTAMFLHADIAHVAMNMFSLYIIGLSVEAKFGHTRFLIIYLLGGLGGSILSVLMHNVLSVGASGAVFAVFGAELVFLYRHRKLLSTAGRAQLRNLLFIAGLNLAIGLVSTLGLGTVVIDNWGHIGGFAGGMALAWYLGPNFTLVRHPQVPDALIAQDLIGTNNRMQVVSLYATVLLVALIVGTLLIQPA